ncbi:hypothetical protein [Microbulbifer taiwanensis]|uniref:hypothetical protein n=1 Tax=Microbulbifer taiwanensis TaxID=986746 RepID=UPI0029C08923|nr:hypothetical protein [Microbulbifer taiwanensis]
MRLLECTTAQYRSLRLTAPNGLPNLLAEAEQQELHYLDFAQRLMNYEIAVRSVRASSATSSRPSSRRRGR